MEKLGKHVAGLTLGDVTVFHLRVGDRCFMAICYLISMKLSNQTI